MFLFRLSISCPLPRTESICDWVSPFAPPAVIDSADNTDTGEIITFPCSVSQVCRSNAMAKSAVSAENVCSPALPDSFVIHLFPLISSVVSPFAPPFSDTVGTVTAWPFLPCLSLLCIVSLAVSMLFFPHPWHSSISAAHAMYPHFLNIFFLISVNFSPAGFSQVWPFRTSPFSLPS